MTNHREPVAYLGGHFCISKIMTDFQNRKTALPLILQFSPTLIEVFYTWTLRRF